MEVVALMTDIVLVAIISLLGTWGGSLGGIVVSARLTNYRIEQLEQKVEKHNNFAERIPVIEEKLKVENHRIDDLEQYHKPKEAT
jgi:hypothetical protein